MKGLALLLCFMLAAVAAFAQWLQATDNIGMEGGDLHAREGSLFCVQHSAVYHSQDWGETWHSGNLGLPDLTYITGFTLSGDLLIMVVDDYSPADKIFASSDQGRSWSQRAEFPMTSLHTLFDDGTTLYTAAYASSGSPMYTSSDGGYTWQTSVTGIEDPWFQVEGYCQSPGALFIFSLQEIYKTTNHGATWSRVQTGITHNSLYSRMLSCEGKLFMACSDGSFLVSADGGATWSTMAGISNTGISDLDYTGGRIFATTQYLGIYELTGDTAWVPVNGSLTNLQSMVEGGSYLFVIESNNPGIYRSSDQFATYTRVNNGLSSDMPTLIYGTGQRLVTTAWDAQILFYSDNQGDQWHGFTAGNIPADDDAFVFHQDDTLLLMGTDRGSYIGSGQGLNWEETVVSGHLPNFAYGYFSSGDHIYAATGDGIYRSARSNLPTWQDMNHDDLVYGSWPYIYHQTVYAIDTLGGSLFVGASFGVYRSDNLGLNWAPVLETANVRQLVSIDGSLLAVSDSGWFRSDSSGGNWLPYSSNLPNPLGVRTFFRSGHRLYLGSYNSGAFLTEDGGVTWLNIGEGIEWKTVTSFVILGDHLYAGTGEGVWKRPLTEVGLDKSPAPAAAILVYPNPAARQVVVELPGMTSAGAILVSLYTMTGQKVLEQLSRESRTTIRLEGLKPGLYLVAVNHNGAIQTCKFIRN
jgi:photosystem II stability/assembly factor-like uncharacterized protein